MVASTSKTDEPAAAHLAQRRAQSRRARRFGLLAMLLLTATLAFLAGFIKRPQHQAEEDRNSRRSATSESVPSRQAGVPPLRR